MSCKQLERLTQLIHTLQTHDDQVAAAREDAKRPDITPEQRDRALDTVLHALAALLRVREEINQLCKDLDK